MCATLSVMVLISIMGCVELIIVETPQKFVNVTQGENVLLQCNFTGPKWTTSLTIRWNFVPTSSITSKEVYYYNAQSSPKAVITESYRGRLQPPSDPGTTRDASIMISNMEPSDDGVYICEVHNLPAKEQSNITVHVLAPSCAPPLPHHHQGKGPRGLYGAGILIAILMGIFLLS